MRYIAALDTDVGIRKENNQDSLLLKHVVSEYGEICMAVLCDGMGGLAKGELASSSVIKLFSDWFDNSLPYEVAELDLNLIGYKWDLMLRDINNKIMSYGQSMGIQLGTTFTGVLLSGDEYLIVHVGDTRVYEISNCIRQLTEDHTFIAREIKNGNMTYEEAIQDRRRNMLLQCIGASNMIQPQIIHGKAVEGVYLLCSDGFRHEVTPDELFNAFIPMSMIDKFTIQNQIRSVIEVVKARRELDNISGIIIRTVR